MKIGFVINPWAGIGGAVALKGSDGKQIRELAIARGAKPRSEDQALTTLQTFLSIPTEQSDLYWYCGSGSMGEDALLKAGLDNLVVSPSQIPSQSETINTIDCLTWFLEQNIDLILFAGGDGTARNLASVLPTTIPVIGIPTGVKIHSAVFAVTPQAAGEVLAGMLNGEITQRRVEEVRDIDEAAFRENKVRSKYYGEQMIPVAGQFMQHVKVGGTESEALVLNEISEWLESNLQDDICYFIGSGKSTAVFMERLQLDNTLLGVDAVMSGQVIQADCTEQDLIKLLDLHSCFAIVSVIGGQGHVFGRGNAQFSPSVLRLLTREHIIVIGTKAKLRALSGRPLLLDTTDVELDRTWAGFFTVTTGYEDEVLYPVV